MKVTIFFLSEVLQPDSNVLKMGIKYFIPLKIADYEKLQYTEFASCK